MNRQQKIELLKRIKEGTATIAEMYNYVFIVENGGEHFISDGHKIGRKLSDSELNTIKCNKVFIDEEDLNC